MMKLLRYWFRMIRIRMMRKKALGRPQMVLPGTVMVLAPHPDDEILGCGGLIRRLVKEGKDVWVVILTGGEKSHAGCCDIDEEELKRERRKLTIGAAGVLGLKPENVFFLDFKDSLIAAGDPERKKLEALLAELKPELVLVPHHFEGWSDHVKTGEMMQEIMRNGACRVMEYCVWFWFDIHFRIGDVDWDRMSLFSMDGDEHRRKCEAIRRYIEPKAPCGRPYSGVLPPVLPEACQWDKEIYFEIQA